MRVKITIDTFKRTVSAESRPGKLTVRTVWSLDDNGDWYVAENMKKLPGMSMFVSTDNVPGQHSLIFDEISDGLTTVFARLELKEEDSDPDEDEEENEED